MESKFSLYHGAPPPIPLGNQLRQTQAKDSAQVLLPISHGTLGKSIDPLGHQSSHLSDGFNKTHPAKLSALKILREAANGNTDINLLQGCRSTIQTEGDCLCHLFKCSHFSLGWERHVGECLLPPRTGCCLQEGIVSAVPWVSL